MVARKLHGQVEGNTSRVPCVVLLMKIDVQIGRQESSVKAASRILKEKVKVLTRRRSHGAQ